MDFNDARRLALALPDTFEQPHHGFPSWRVRAKIFATLPSDGHLHVMLSEDKIREVVAAEPACEEKWWGKKLSAVRISLADINEDVLTQLLRDAWEIQAGV